jgi:transcriptional regulator with XRE-family HTH domain
VSTTISGPDGKSRCSWSGAAPEFLAYHDAEWGFPVGCIVPCARKAGAVFVQLRIVSTELPRKLRIVSPELVSRNSPGTPSQSSFEYCHLRATLTRFPHYEACNMPTPHYPPAAVRRTLRKLGADIHDARRRRRLPMAVVAERAFTSRSTLQRIEAGDANVGIGIYAAVLQALGLLDGLGEIADISRDSVGQALASAELPERVRIKRTPRKPDDA